LAERERTVLHERDVRRAPLADRVPALTPLPPGDGEGEQVMAKETRSRQRATTALEGLADMIEALMLHLRIPDVLPGLAKAGGGVTIRLAEPKGLPGRRGAGPSA